MNFNDVPEGETAARAIVFSAVSCGAVHLSITAGPTVVGGPAGTASGRSRRWEHPSRSRTSRSSTPPRGRLWLSYEGTSAGDVATGTVTVHCAETNQDFVVPIAANTIARPTVATMLVLDQSGSMDWLAGIDASTKESTSCTKPQGPSCNCNAKETRSEWSADHNSYPGAPVTVHGRCVRPARGPERNPGPGTPRSDIDWCWRRARQKHTEPRHGLRPQGDDRLHRRPENTPPSSRMS